MKTLFITLMFGLLFACSKPAVPLVTALQQCQGTGAAPAFYDCMYEKGWDFEGGQWWRRK